MNDKRELDPETGKILYVTKMTPQVVDIIVNAVEAQAAVETAASLSNVSLRTLRRWMKEGRAWLDAHDEDDAPSDAAQFVMRIERAQELAKQRLIDGIVSARDPRMNLEILQRRYPREWGKREQLDVGLQDPRLAVLVPLLKERGLLIEKLSPEKLDAFIELALEMAPDAGVVDVPRRALEA